MLEALQTSSILDGLFDELVNVRLGFGWLCLVLLIVTENVFWLCLVLQESFRLGKDL